jgi:predicted nucleic acid-binding Zn ribbon protein
MEAIKSTINNVMQKLKSRKKASLKDDPAVWLKKALSKKELKHIRANYFKNGILNIKVDSSVWLYHWNLQKEDLLNKLRAKSVSVIKDIRFSLGETR